jgi:hypothetical protein
VSTERTYLRPRLDLDGQYAGHARSASIPLLCRSDYESLLDSFAERSRDYMRYGPFVNMWEGGEARRPSL